MARTFTIFGRRIRVQRKRVSTLGPIDITRGWDAWRLQFGPLFIAVEWRHAVCADQLAAMTPDEKRRRSSFTAL